MVEFRGVSKVYARGAGGRVQALVDATFVIEAGELVSVSGPAGAGKSTLLRLIAGVDRPSAGTVLVDGEDVGRLGAGGLARLRRHLAVVPQDGLLIADRTVLGNVTLVLRARGLSRRDARGQALAALRDAGLGAVPNARPAELAAGERRRLQLARALALAPSLLLLDEPLAAMDEASTRELVELLRGVHAGGTTVVVATREPGWAEALKARALVLAGGRVQTGGALESSPSAA